MKTVLVTGGTGGIGEAICREFAKNGYFAGVGFCRFEAKANEIAKDIGGTGVYMDFARKNHSRRVRRGIRQSVFRQR